MDHPRGRRPPHEEGEEGMTDPGDTHRRLAEALDVAHDPERRAQPTPEERAEVEAGLAEALTHHAGPTTTKENAR